MIRFMRFFVILFVVAVCLAFSIGVQADGPIGEILIYAGSTPPSGYLLANGACMPIWDAPDLYAVIGCDYGCVFDSFCVPDLTGRFIIGAQSQNLPCGSGVTCSIDLTETGGESEHELTTDELPAHRHQIHRSVTKFLASGSNAGFPGASAGGEANYGENTRYLGSDYAHNNLPPFIALNFIIRSSQTAPTDTPTPTNTATATPTPTDTPTPTSTFTPTPTGTPVGGVHVYTHTLQSGKTLTVPVQVSFGEIIAVGCGLLFISIAGLRLLNGVAYNR